MGYIDTYPDCPLSIATPAVLSLSSTFDTSLMATLEEAPVVLVTVLTGRDPGRTRIE